MRWRSTLSAAVPAVIAFLFLLGFVNVLGLILRERKVSAGNSLSEDYLRAVHETVRADSSVASHSLVSINAGQPVTVVTWMGQDKIQYFKGATTPQGRDTWVTVVPNLRFFCQNYVKLHGADPEQLALRMKQRLGMPPDAANDSFVELTIDPKYISKIFRPCGDPSLETHTCQPASEESAHLPRPEKMGENLKALDTNNASDVEKYWILSNYYWSFASSHQYPWTSLGYTFDWAPKEDGSGDFVRWGESEFVIPGGTPIHFVSAANTVAYCTPQ
jgi:hypothetical protein